MKYFRTAQTLIFIISIQSLPRQTTTLDIPEDNEEENKTVVDMGFLHTKLGTGEKEMFYGFQ